MLHYSPVQPPLKRYEKRVFILLFCSLAAFQNEVLLYVWNADKIKCYFSNLFSLENLYHNITLIHPA